MPTMTSENSPSELESRNQCVSLTYGWSKFRPPCLRFLTNPKWFLVVIMVYTLGAGISMSGLPILILPSIEKRFSLTSKELGIIAAANDVAAIVFVVFIGFYGDYGNKIKWVGGGAGVAGFGLILFTIPHLIIGRYDVPDFQSGNSGVCLSSTSTSSSSSCDGKGRDAMWYNMMIFVIAQFIHGAGICPLYTLVPAYIDENVEPKQMPIYLGLWYVCGFLGPGLGTLLSGQLLSVFVDIDQPRGLNLTPKDPRWIGAWWLGFLVFGLLFIFLAIAILGFPSSLPGAKERRQKYIREGIVNKKSSKKEAKLKEILPEFKSLLVNWTFLFNSLGVSAALMFGGGLIPFLGKILQLKFDLDVVSNGYVLSVTLLPTILVGTLFGTFIVRLFPVKTVCKRSALYVAVVQTLGCTAAFAILLRGCANVNMAGVTRSYSANVSNDQTLSKYSTDPLVSHCNINCSCITNHFTPVCGSDNVVYANPCLAGCTARFSHNKTFGNCSCVNNEGNKMGTAREGYCDRKCENLVIFLVIIGIGLSLSYSCGVPVETVVLRCVPDDKRAFAFGIQYVLYKTIGLISGPIVLGHLLDICCKFWQNVCKQRGKCFIYDVDLVDRNVFIFGITTMGTAAVLYTLSWHFYNPETTIDDNMSERDEAKSPLKGRQPQANTASNVENGITSYDTQM